MTAESNARAEIADSVRRFRAWKAEMRSKGLTGLEASRIATGQQQHEMWQIEQRLTAPNAAEAGRRIKTAEPEFRARQQALWKELMDTREQAARAAGNAVLTNPPLTEATGSAPIPWDSGITGYDEAEAEAGA